MSDAYQKSFDALGNAIRAALDLISKKDPETYSTAMAKREMERQLQTAGHTKSEAKAEVSRIFAIDKLGDNDS